MWRIVSENVHKTCYLKLFHLRERKHSPPKELFFRKQMLKSVIFRQSSDICSYDEKTQTVRNIYVKFKLK